MSGTRHRQHALRSDSFPGRPCLDLRTHRRAYPTLITRRPPAIFHFTGAIGGEGRLPVLPQPVTVEARVQVIPRQYLVIVALSRGVPAEAHRAVAEDGRACGNPPAEREVLTPAVEP